MFNFFFSVLRSNILKVKGREKFASYAPFNSYVLNVTVNTSFVISEPSLTGCLHICFFSCSALSLTHKAPDCALFCGVIIDKHEEEI